MIKRASSKDKRKESSADRARRLGITRRQARKMARFPDRYPNDKERLEAAKLADERRRQNVGNNTRR